VEVNFGSSRLYTVGVEEELQIVNAESFELVSRFDEVADAAGEDARIKPELLQSTVEVATHVSDTVPHAIEDAAGLRAKLRDAATETGSLIVSAGTHPFARYEHEDVTDQERYRDLVDSLQWVAERALIFGLHVHVGLDDAQKAIAVTNALSTWLPELLALSANSPFWLGRDTGLASTRIKIFDPFPRSGLPPAFSSWEEFELLVERGAKTNSFPDYTHIWWDLRPHPKLGTIEVRICDGQTRIESVAGIVALVQSLVATLAERYEREGMLPIQPVTLVGENKWRAARYGLDADLIWLERDEERSAREAVRALVELAEPAAQRLGCARELAEVEAVCGRGSGAREQCATYADTESLLAVVQGLADRTTSGL
jgi:glutamate---cysteine ligase / carboxylate-amine ligase